MKIYRYYELEYEQKWTKGLIIPAKSQPECVFLSGTVTMLLVISPYVVKSQWPEFGIFNKSLYS